MIQSLYIIPSYNCNLSCKHCNIKNIQLNENIDYFLNVLKNIKFEHGTLFGGEPLLQDNDTLRKIFSINNVESVSTNLLNMDTEKLELICEFGLDVATSWNPFRFTVDQEKIWFTQLNKLINANINLTVLITLTDDLFLSNINSILDKLNYIGPMSVKFEPYVQSSKILIQKADEWLVSFDRKWYWNNLKNILKENYKSGNILNCHNKWTLKPDGSLVHTCPTDIQNILLNECLTCKYNTICMPCQKQNVCSFFKKFFEYTNSCIQE